MQKLLFTVAALTLLVAPSVAQSEGTMGGLGFHAVSSPFAGLGPIIGSQFGTPTLGVRQWFSERVGGDIGLGYMSFSEDPGDTKITGFGLSVGVPISLRKVGESVNFIFRPGVLFTTLEEEQGPPPILTTKWTGFAVSGELEAEWMMTDRLSMSASHGLVYSQIKDDGSPAQKFTTIGSTGSGFTQLGFHLYLW